MSFTALALFGGAAPLDAFSSPNRVSVVVADTGSGGQIQLNGLGVVDPTVSGALDLQKFFGTAFDSQPLLRAFRALPTADSSLAEAQLVKSLLITVVNIAGSPTKQPNFAYLGLGVGGVNVPFLTINGPAVSGEWRLDIQFRHSLIA
jgi:hypothetical protein